MAEAVCQGDGLSLRAWVAWGALLFAVSAVGLTGGLSWISGQRAVDNLASQLQTRANAQVEEHLRAYFGAPHQVIHMMADAVELGVVDFAKPETIYSYLWRIAISSMASAI